MLWTGSVMSPYPGDYLPREGIGAHGGNDAEHGEAALNHFAFFVESEHGRGKSESFGEVIDGVC